MKDIKKKILTLFFMILLAHGIVLYINLLLFQKTHLTGISNFILYFLFFAAPFNFVLLSQIILTNYYQKVAEKKYHGKSFIMHGLKKYTEDPLYSFYLIDPVLLMNYAKKTFDSVSFLSMKKEIDQLKRWNKPRKTDTIFLVAISVLSFFIPHFRSTINYNFLGLGYIMLGIARSVLFHMDSKKYLAAINELKG